MINGNTQGIRQSVLQQMELMQEIERRAKELGADTVRLDTFSFQGQEFYEARGSQVVGHYANETDGYEEFFFLKRI